MARTSALPLIDTFIVLTVCTDSYHKAIFGVGTYCVNKCKILQLFNACFCFRNDWVGRTPVPTHFFIVLTICSDPDTDIGPLCDVEDLQVAAYIFPHTEGIRTCDGVSLSEGTFFFLVCMGSGIQLIISNKLYRMFKTLI